MDGTSNTILTVHAGPEKAVIWTKPEDLEFKPDFQFSDLGTLPVTGFYVGKADGMVNRVNVKMPMELFIPLVTASGGEKIDYDEMKKYLSY